ncbi:sensor histidine kinase [Rossellomorea vietnamensis]|uniref:histidine kinase n=1 Tax=Rossellomorea aquimaris TaxID=189382 RepID=A0A5D4TLV3_9BACI|nr:HAMP domain-containing sensor histidine kinase [Rossellomorea aquimaris]TYS75462.1 HAMP domain-containing histidine kinase [Rossellomorea aquimaris]
MKRRKYWLKNRKSLVYQFTTWYVWYFIAFLLLIGIVVLSSVSYFLLQDTKNELPAMEKQLKGVLNEHENNIQQALDRSLYPENADYFVKVSVREEVLASSRGWEDMIEDEDLVSMLWSEQLVFNDDEGFFYTSTIPWEANGQRGNMEIYVHLEEQGEFLGLLLQILLITGLISLIAGSVLIYLLAKRSLRPLLLITDTIERMRGPGDLKRRLPVPDKPKELIELSTTFNEMLQQIEEQFEREKSFVSNASHELRTPLTAFRGHLKLIKRWGKDRPEVLQNSIIAMDMESARMERVMVQMLMIARNEHAENRIEKVNITSVIKEVVSQFQDGDSVKLLADLRDNSMMSGDEEQLRQIVVILIENALRYTNEGTVSVQLSQERSQIILRVCDTGIGIPKDEQDNIFDRFYRVDKNRSRKTGGTGLGLSIAKELIANHNGTISVESETGVGSTFTVHFPVRE